MVVLNEFLPINILSLKTHISNKLIDIFDDNLDYYIETSTVIKKNDKKKLFNNIVKDVKNLFSSDHFLYLIMDNNYCIHKYRKGKNEGKYCAKKIRSNNPKKVYLCCSHDKDHIPKKKNISIDNTSSPIELINNNINDNKFKNKIDKNDDDNRLNNKVINNLKTDINIKIEDTDKGYETKSNNRIKNRLLNKKGEKKNIKIKENQLKSTINDINKKYNDIDNSLNKININKNNRYNHKYGKRDKWQKLDILQDTGFIFG